MFFQSLTMLHEFQLIQQSSILGPNVIQAIVNHTNNNWMGFPFLFALCAFASIIIWFVDVEKGREDCRIYVAERKAVHTVSRTLRS